MWLARLIAQYESCRWRQASRRQLRALDERLLRDIGVSRIEAQQEAHKPFWRA